MNFTVAYWINYTNVIGDLPIFANSPTSLSSPGYTFAPDFNGGAGWSFTTSATDRRYSSSPAVNDGNWHHVAVTSQRDGVINTYIDGVQVNSQLGYSGDVNTGARTVIGQGNTFDYTGFASEGETNVTAAFELDDLGVWRRALSAYEVYNMFYVGKNYGQSFDSYGPVSIVMRKAGNDVEIIWQAGTLKESTSLSGPWNAVSGATAPYYKSTPGAGQNFYRVEL